MSASRRVVEIDTTYRPRGLLRILGGDADPKPPSHMAAALRALSKALAGRRRPFQLGHVFMLVGGFCIASTAALLAGAFLLPSDIWSRINNGVIGRFLPFAGIAWMPGCLLLLRGVRMMNRSAERVLRETGQKPILFLRPFHTDSWATASLGDEEPFDVIIARCFGSYGPVISVARPGERRFGRQAADRAIYGMSREYFSDDGWRDGVVRRMQEALLTVVVAGSTGGLKWELEQLVGSGHLSKLIILRGPIKDTKAAGARMLHDTLRLIPGCEGRVQPDQLVGVIAVYFGADDEIVLLRSQRERAYEYQRAVGYAVYGLLCASPGARAPDAIPA